MRARIVSTAIAVVLLSLVGGLLRDARAAIPPSERQALIDLYNSTNGSGWTDKTNWLGPAGTEGTWYGIQVSGDHVVAIFLNNNNLAGTIPSSLGNLFNLKYLYIGANHLTGNIPADLGHLTNLLHLNLESNQLTGAIPPELGSLMNLTHFDLEYNQFTGGIPSWLGNLSHLAIIHLESNQLTGAIPPELGNLKNLTELYLSFNQLTGRIPSQLGNLTHLTDLGLHFNQFTGSIPPELGNLTNLTELILYSNQLTGTIPVELSSLTSLTNLYLGRNQLTGGIPSWLGNLTHLTSLSLDANQLTGAIPPEMGSLTNLIKLYLGSNQLTGTIPKELGKLTNLTHLWLNSNKLAGPIPAELLNLTNLADNQSDFRYNHLYTFNTAIRDFLNSKQIGGNWVSFQTGLGAPPDKPSLSFPANGATGVVLIPTLQTGPFHDPDPGDTHRLTEWEISKGSNLSSTAFYTKRSTYLTSLPIPPLNLRGGTTYYWRVRFYDNRGNVSEWSDTYSFTTRTVVNDLNANGIPDNLENKLIDMDKDGIPDIQKTYIKSLNTVVGNGQMGVSRKNAATVTSLDSIDSIDPATISSIGRPYSMPLGLFAIRLDVANPGDTAQVVVYFSHPAAANAKWLMHDPIKGWVDYSSHATFSADRKSVTLELKDGDYGDADGVANGTIIDPGGFGLASWITGFISNAATGAGVGQAQINIADMTFYTDLDGYFLGMLLPNAYPVSVSAAGYDPVNTSVNIPEAQTVTLDLQMTSLSPSIPLYFPHSATTGGWETEVAAINTSPTQTAACTLNGYSDQGAIVETQSITLSPHGRREITLSQEFANHGSIGYLILFSDTNTVKGYTKFYRQGQYRVAIPAVSDVNTSDIYIPHIAADAAWWTGISLVNTTAERKVLTITFNNGQTGNITLNANEHRAVNIAQEFFNNQPRTDIQSAVITNASGVIGLELFGSLGWGTQLEGILLTGNIASTLYYPHVAGGEWWTGIVAYNPSDLACTITLTPYTVDGSPLTPVTPPPIAGKGKYIGAVSTLGLPDQTAWFRIDSTRPLSGFELFGTTDGQQLGAYAGGDATGATEGIFAKIEKNGWTGIAFVNTEAVAASVTLTAYNDNGTAVATRVLPPIAGHAKVVNNPELIFTQDISGATYIAYTSSRNVVGFQLNGSSDGTMLDGLPGM